MDMLYIYQLLLIPLAVGPGILAFLKIVSPTQAACLVLLAYVLSRRIDNESQKRLAEKKRLEEEKVKQEQEEIAKLPSKRRKNIEKGIEKKNSTSGQ